MRRALAGACALAFAAVLAAGLACGRRERERPVPVAAAAETPRVRLSVELYFPGERTFLERERREIETTALPEDQIAAVVGALLAGPDDSGLAAVFEQPVEVGPCYLSPDGVAYVDLRSADGAPLPGLGSTQEIQTVYSLVNSVALNVNDVRRVVLLWNGTQPATFGGHLDTSLPLAPLRGLAPRG
ncbi:MAG TPA: GerMN domain-containing protein [Thermoanaerobaculia bacterium]|nr:GerMN domain-containing protein [Thermoanaerobaculia bacterium]